MTNEIPVLPRISDYVDYHAARAPDREAVIDSQQRLTYCGFEGIVDCYASALVGAGVSKGDRVATLGPPDVLSFALFLAASSIGAIWVGLNPKHRFEELRYVLHDAAPTILFARERIGERDYASDLAALQNSIPPLRQIVVIGSSANVEGASTLHGFIRDRRAGKDEVERARSGCGGRDPCLLVYTSGSTGRPKGALLHHQGIIHFAVQQNRLWKTIAQRALNYLPISHIGSIVDVSAFCLVAGGTVVFTERFDARESLELIQRERISFWGSVPSAFHLQLALPDFEQFDLSGVDLIAWGGAAMPRDVLERLALLDRPMATNYGMSETTSSVTSLGPTRNLDLLSRSVGKAFPGAEVRIVGPDGCNLDEGTPGEIWVRSDQNMLGYWNNPTASAAAFSRDGFLKTGDVGVALPDGAYSITGRINEMFKSGGYNIYPREIEAVLEEHPLVDMAAVIAVEDPAWQQVGIAFVEAKDELDVETLGLWCRERLANYKVPKRFRVLPQLPLLAVGKVDKSALARTVLTE